ncbi:MAG: glycosyltransferase family 4 protein [Anaerolineae bacterium]
MNSRKPLVVFNAHLLAGDASYRSAGISVYIANLLRALDLANLDYRFQILMGHGYLPDGVRFPVVRSRLSTAQPWRRLLWEQAVMPGWLRRLQVDLLHAPAFVGPLLTRRRQVITVHDLSFLRYPEYFRRGNRTYLRMMTRLACRRATAVIAVSDFTAGEVVRLLGVPEDRVFRVYNGVDPRFRPLPEAEVARFRREEGLPDRFVLAMGTLEPRKNLIRLIRAFARLKDPGLHLVLAGGCGWFYGDIFAEVEHFGLVDRVHFPGYVSAESQPFWYNAARASAYVSMYEGFGLPVVEALACGTPTLTSSTTSLPEVGGDSVLTVPPDDEAAMADALHTLVSDEGVRGQLRQQGLERAAAFSWKKTAEGTMDVYAWALGAQGN